ncbi:hypothetical protein CKAH01_05999 [Colletotrichum kahawae]|uniref:Uncharacterized protein n=1 Tax=Colletotrichum kahawae TaxID=34407 RepID=A0AAD9YC18_COLKA|nr:hypothetical protein CKAH01_05999 [Colletotrichum kahawae]
MPRRACVTSRFHRRCPSGGRHLPPQTSRTAPRSTACPAIPSHLCETTPPDTFRDERETTQSEYKVAQNQPGHLIFTSTPLTLAN